MPIRTVSDVEAERKRALDIAQQILELLATSGATADVQIAAVDSVGVVVKRLTG